MPSVIARVTPTDYDAWHKLHIDVLREHGTRVGITSEVIYRDHDDPRTVVILQHFASFESHKEFMASPFMQETIEKAPIEGPPTLWYVDEAEVVDTTKLQ